MEALNEALVKGRPAVFNTDQETRTTSWAFAGFLERQGVTINMDGRGS